MLLPSVLNQFFSSVMQGIEESVQARGYQVMMSTTRSDPQIEQSYIEFLYNKSIDGIIFFNSEQTPEALTGFQKISYHLLHQQSGGSQSLGGDYRQRESGL